MADAERREAARYERKLRAALESLPEACPTARAQNRVARRALVLAICLTLAACTALAAVRLGFLDFAHHYDPALSGDLTGLVVEGTLATCETEHVRYEVRAASCDGKELQLVVAAMPKDTKWALVQMGSIPSELAEAAGLAPNLRRTQPRLESVNGMDIHNWSYTFLREERGLVFGMYAGINVSPGEAVTVTLRCSDYRDWATDGQAAEMTFTFTAATPELTAFEADADLGSVRVTGVELSHTALALHATVTYEPITDRGPSFCLLQKGGSIQWSVWGRRDEDGAYRAHCVYATTQAMPEAVLLWPYSERDDCDLALQINTVTGEARVIAVTPGLDGAGEICVSIQDEATEGDDAK